MTVLQNYKLLMTACIIGLAILGLLSSSPSINKWGEKTFKTKDGFFTFVMVIIFLPILVLGISLIWKM